MQVHDECRCGSSTSNSNPGRRDGAKFGVGLCTSKAHTECTTDIMTSYHSNATATHSLFLVVEFVQLQRACMRNVSVHFDAFGSAQ